STTAEDYSSEVKKPKNFQNEEVDAMDQMTSGGSLQEVEDILAEKSREVEKLNRELEEMRSAFGADGVQQLQDFEAALKQRDGIITQLTANLQQAREEKDEIMKEFLELTEQSQKLQIQFQQLQAGESLRNSSHSNTAADLLQARQQLLQLQQQLQEQLLLEQSAIISEHEQSLSLLREELSRAAGENNMQQTDEKDQIIAEKERLERCLETLESTKSDLESCKNELNNCKLDLEKEHCELEHEIMQLMGTVEDLQKRCHKGSLSENETIQKMQEDAERKLEVLRAELDEMYGQQIVQMKVELNLQNAERIEQINQQHQVEIELLKTQYLSETLSASTSEKEALNGQIKQLQDTIEQSRVIHNKTVQELNKVTKENLNLQEKVDGLLQDLKFAKEQVELVSHNAVSQESHKLQLLQETIDNLKRQLETAQETAQEMQEKYESETTNYKIKLEMLEREKDEVLDRMAESQEAELERLRTQLLFSHEEELTNLREDLQRESFLNTENLLNEAAIKHEKALDDLRISYDEKVNLLQQENENIATERDELLHQILELKEDLNVALHSSKADELVQQLQELQTEIEELRKGGEKRISLDNEIRGLQEKIEALEKQAKENKQMWDNALKERQTEIEILNMSNKALKEEMDLKLKDIENITAEKNRYQQQVVTLKDEMEKQSTTFSFAEKNFEVNYQELKDEYTCLVEAKTKLEEQKILETLELEAKISSLEAQIQKMEDRVSEIKMDEGKIVVEKDTTELMEKLNFTLIEKESLTGRLHEVMKQLATAEGKVGCLEEELIKVKQENAKVIAQNENLGKEIKKTHENTATIFNADSQQLRGEIQTLQSLLRETEEERDKIRQTLELQRVSLSLNFNTIDLNPKCFPVESIKLHFLTSLCLDLSEQAHSAAAVTSTSQTSSEIQMLKVEAQQKQKQLEHSHRQEVERLRAHYQQQAAETEERYATELFMLQQRLQEVNASGIKICLKSFWRGGHNVDFIQHNSAKLKLKLSLYSLIFITYIFYNKIIFLLQLEHAKLTQTELMRESFRHNQEMSELLQRQDELQERLSEEARAREQLALELHRAEGVIDGYTGERAALEEQLRQKEELLLSLEQELEVTSSRLHELEQERLQLQEERELMSRQQEAMREEAGPRELHLLEETEKLMQEKVEVQRQAEKQSSDLLKQVKLLEAELEEQVTRVMDLEQTQSSETADLQQQIQALEKQLDKNRRFLDEQAVDREHERDFFQTEIQKLEDQLKSSQKPQSGSEQRNLEVEQLSAQLKEKADWCSELLLSSEQLQRDLSERDEEIDKLESRIRELEQALLASTESLEVSGGAEARHPSLEAQLQTEREALERKEKEICNLEEQLEQFKEELENKSEELQQLQMQLEIQRKEIDSQQQDLDTRDSLLQVINHNCITLYHYYTEMDERDEVVRDLESQVECLRSEQQRLKRDHAEEMDQLNAVIDKLQQDLANIEQKTGAVEDYEEDKDLPGRPTSEEYDEVKQKMDSATKELDTLKSEHGKLLDTYLRLKESAKALAESEKAENSESSEIELEDVLREKTAALVVMQAQVQALEQSATYKVEELDRQIHELQDLVEERDNELSRCRFLVEQTQNYADGLQEKIYKLEENLRDKVASALVSQATLEAFQQQQSPQPKHQPVVYDFGSFNIPHMDFSGHSQTRGGSTGRVVHLTEKLRELEVGLSGMQKDQELQNQLLSSSEEDVLEYERRLALLMDLLSQMKSGASHRSAPMLQVKADEDRDSFTEVFHNLEEATKTAASTKEELNNMKQQNIELEDELKSSEVAISQLKEQLQEVRNNMENTKEELIGYKEQNTKLQNEASERESLISSLKVELQEAHTALVKQTDISSPPSPSPSPQPPSSSSSISQSKKKGMEEVIGNFQEKIEQMQELHAAEILDMESRHIAESENLRRDTQALEDECKALKSVIEKLRSSNEVPVHLSSAHVYNRLDVTTIEMHIDPKTGIVLTSASGQDMTSPVSSMSTGQLQRVHQEGMQVLSLSELPLSEADPSAQFNVQGWAKERDALLSTVESLKGLITSMQTHTESQTSGGVDWRGQLLEAVQKVFQNERSVLKNTLYSQLDLLDTSDAIIHLNQLEQRLAEQQREAIGLLHSSDRSSLLSEIHYLQSQMERLNQGKSFLNFFSVIVGGDSAAVLGAELSLKEQTEAEGERVLVEDLKTELSQTKLELETTLKAQHKHIKELDTLRAEVSQKASEVDALSDQLIEEKKKSRELQWAVEKERCRTGRDEENKREELEDLQLDLEEQRALVSRLTSELEQQRQTSAQSSQQLEQERLSLQRRLQELQVQLDTERAKAQEMSSALGRERELRRGGSADSGGPVTGEGGEEKRGGTEEDENILDRLQKELDDKHAQVCNHNGWMIYSLVTFTIYLPPWRYYINFIYIYNIIYMELHISTQWESETSDRTKDWVMQQKTSSPSSHLDLTGPGTSSGLPVIQPCLFAGASCLFFIIGASVALLCLTTLSSPQSSLLAGGSSSLTERLLRQNAELTGFVSRLTEEKNDLRNQMLRLEEELRRYRHSAMGSTDSSSRRGGSQGDSTSLLLSQERETWTRERARLEKALHQAQSQIARLKTEVRTETLREISGPEADNAALKRMYGRYLRSESFRKALVYQKKYLLLLLGGFQECEEATLTLLSRMGGRPALSGLESFSQRRKGLTRFRSAVRVSIALSRMRFLVKRWHKATGMSSSPSPTVTKNGLGQTLGKKFCLNCLLKCIKKSNLYLYHMSGEHGPLTCSHLQNYDPDRALTDYISRLEALQRRLGSASSSYAQLHFGLRR
uniref:Pericentrin/AKAP-450 centrosomal targeting domain-containing protein n=1 Tax=Periophthalmus magnuspinnatus TaxID=409849 RepID=A0A3B4BA49_9GOBI